MALFCPSVFSCPTHIHKTTARAFGVSLPALWVLAVLPAADAHPRACPLPASGLGWPCAALYGLLDTPSEHVSSGGPVQPHGCPSPLDGQQLQDSSRMSTSRPSVSSVSVFRERFACIFGLAEQPASQSPTAISLFSFTTLTLQLKIPPWTTRPSVIGSLHAALTSGSPNASFPAVPLTAPGALLVPPAHASAFSDRSRLSGYSSSWCSHSTISNYLFISCVDLLLCPQPQDIHSRQAGTSVLLTALSPFLEPCRCTVDVKSIELRG